LRNIWHLKNKSDKMDFKSFEEILESDIFVHGGGLLRKTPTVKKWDKVAVGNSQVDGLGIWAIEPITDNEVIEECPVLIVAKEEIVNTSLIDYAFKLEDNKYALALGNGSLYNHRNQPNARWHYDENKERIVFRASRIIKAGEEIFISYGKDYWKSRDVGMKGELNLTNTSLTR
jgi:SET domain-containing protein